MAAENQCCQTSCRILNFGRQAQRSRDVAGAARGGQGGVAPAACRGTRNEVNLPHVTPMPLALARLDAPFDHPDFIFKPKLDGFRAVAYVEGGACRLVSRNRNAFKTFEGLAQAIGQELSVGAPS